MAEAVGRALVVDDNEDDHFQLARLLRGEVSVTAAYTGQEALERLARESFDVLITDQKMPRMSGDTLVARVKSDERFCKLRCILLSGRTSDEQLVQILRGGRIFHYFEKNKTLLTEDGRAELLLAVRNAVSASQLEREHEILTQRLRSQVDALSGQYVLLRALVSLKDPVELLKLVISSLARRLPCRAALGLVDLRPAEGTFGHIEQREGAFRLSAIERTRLEAHALSTFSRLSGRDVGDVIFSHIPEEAATDGQTTLREPSVLLPVFVNRDLRGVIVLARDNDSGLEPDEAELFGIWRDQLQDALTRVHMQRLDEQRRLELMLETMTEGVVLTDEVGAVTLMNPAARRLLGVREVDRPDFSVVVAAMGLSSLDVLRQLGVGQGNAIWRELRLGEGFCHVLFATVRDHSGEFVGVLTVMRDVTAQKQTENQREEFVHIIGHELRSPLTSINGVLDLLTKKVLGELTERQLDYVGMARDSCVKINHILNDLLDLAKFEKGKMPLAIEEISLDRVVEEAVRRFEPVAVERRIELSNECLLNGLMCQADAYRIGQVMSNLLSNALKFTPEGGKVVVTVFTAFAAPDLYLVSVHNTGEEIADRDLDRVFDKFEQVRLQERRTVGGTGLGLSICRNIVLGHRGRIWAESGQGEGTAFVFSLPCSADPRDGQPALGSRPSSVDGRPLLIVCQEPQEALALKALLLDMDFRVRVCRPELEAVRRQISLSQPALALYLDVDGHPVKEVLEELAGHHDLPVVGLWLPGSPRSEIVDLTLDVPPEPVILASSLNVVLGRQRQRRRMRILLADRDEAWSSQIADRLEEAGYLAYTASGAEEALRRAQTLLPDLVVLDASLSGAASVKAQLSAAMPILIRGEAEAAEALGAGGRYLEPAAGSRALLLGVRSALTEERSQGLGALVALPGGRELQRELQARLRERQPFAYCAVDIEGLRDAIEYKGFMWGHSAMAHVAELIHRVLQEQADGRAFLGHLRDDDFVFLVAPEHCRAVCHEIIRAFSLLEPVLKGRDVEGPSLRLVITALVDHGGRYDRYGTVQGELNRARARLTADQPVLIDDGE